jgi:hypothetical protein
MAATKAPARKAGPVRATTLRVGTGSQASRASAITSPTGGATIDSQARTAIDAIITVLENFGLVTPN